MTRSAPDAAISEPNTPRCTGCGQALDHLERGRCPLCGLQIEEEPITAEDTSPYAATEKPGWGSWLAMTWHIWSANSGRLAHLSLMCISLAARKYSWRNLFPLAFTVAFCWLTLSGWHEVKILAEDAGGEPPQPSGRGWVQIAQMPAAGIDDPNRIVGLWWNPPLAVAGAAVSLIWCTVLIGLLMPFLRMGVEHSLRPQFRGEERLSAALCYATAWAAPLVPAGLVLAALPLCLIGRLEHWLYPVTESTIFVVAAIPAALAIFAGWFGLIRLAYTVPVVTRTRVLLFFGLWMPVVIVMVLSGSFFGLRAIQRVLASSLQVLW